MRKEYFVQSCGICALTGSGSNPAVFPSLFPQSRHWLILATNTNLPLFGWLQSYTLFCKWFRWGPSPPKVSKMEQVSQPGLAGHPTHRATGMGEGVSLTQVHLIKINSRTKPGDSRVKHSLLLHGLCTGGDWPWNYGGQKMAPRNEANTGKDRSEAQEKIALMISLEPWFNPCWKPDFLWILNELPCPCLSLSRFSFYL